MLPVGVEDPNLAIAEACAVLCVADCLFLGQEYGLHIRRLIDLPAVSEWSDFDDCHGYAFAFV